MGTVAARHDNEKIKSEICLLPFYPLWHRLITSRYQPRASSSKKSRFSFNAVRLIASFSERQRQTDDFCHRTVWRTRMFLGWVEIIQGHIVIQREFGMERCLVAQESHGVQGRLLPCGDGIRRKWVVAQISARKRELIGTLWTTVDRFFGFFDFSARHCFPATKILGGEEELTFVGPIAKTTVNGVGDFLVAGRELKRLLAGRIEDGDLGGEPARAVVFIATSWNVPEIVVGHACAAGVAFGVGRRPNDNFDTSRLNVLGPGVNSGWFQKGVRKLREVLLYARSQLQGTWWSGLWKQSYMPTQRASFEEQDKLGGRLFLRVKRWMRKLIGMSKEQYVGRGQLWGGHLFVESM